MRIKITKGVACNPWHLSALIGDVVELDAKQAKELIEAERAIETTEPLRPIVEVVETEPTPKKKGK